MLASRTEKQASNLMIREVMVDASHGSGEVNHIMGEFSMPLSLYITADMV